MRDFQMSMFIGSSQTKEVKVQVLLRRVIKGRFAIHGLLIWFVNLKNGGVLKTVRFSGIITALITPFSEGKLHKESFLRLLDSQVRAGITQFVLASTTGESPVFK